MQNAYGFSRVLDCPIRLPTVTEEKTDRELRQSRSDKVKGIKDRPSEQVLFARKDNDQELQEGSSLVLLLKACAKEHDLREGSRIHADIIKKGLLEKDTYVSNTLLHMYAKCGEITKAQELFNQLPVQTLVSWNALIAGYAQYGQGNEVLKFFARMQDEGLRPNAVTFASVLKACSSIGAIEKGKEIYAEIKRQKLLEHDIILGTALIDMFAKCGALAKAEEVFNELTLLSVAAWNALIGGYAQHGDADKALHCFEQMQDEGFPPNNVTFVCILGICSATGLVENGEQIHAEVARQKLLKRDVVLGNALINMYAKCGVLQKAQEVLEKLPKRNVISWGALIAGYAQHGHSLLALDCFSRMQDEGITPNVVTYSSILKACGDMQALEKGRAIHREVAKQGLLEGDVVLGTAMVDMYVKCGIISTAQTVFDELEVQNVTSWNVLISGYVQQGHNDKGLDYFRQMQHEGVYPNAVTFACILKVCGKIGAIEKGEEIHTEVSKQGLLGNDPMLHKALMDMYIKCESVQKANEVFGKLPMRDVVTWNTLITGYVQNGQGNEALKCFEQMQDAGLLPNEVTFVCILKACAIIGAAAKGEEIHNDVASQGLLVKDGMFSHALVDMYAKCGILVKAQEIFNELPVQDVVHWSMLLAGYAHLGKAGTVFILLNKMLEKSIGPDLVIFCIVLAACSHLGLVDEGQMHLEQMFIIYDIIPTLDHYTCIVDLYGRSGHLNKAVSVIEKIPLSGCLQLWSALLGACGKWKDVEGGRWVFEHAAWLDESYSPAYVWMSNIFSTVDMQEKVQNFEVMQETGCA